ncbi:MAG: NTP transferase domain-containing protein [Myxococcales bacterium]|nr:NTP transferase domain-containing protein [Myxococcales bacterium]
MNEAFVLAAGLGTRLRPLTQFRPKPLVPVCGVPLLAYSLALCARHGLRRVVVNAHWLAEQVEAWAGEREGVHVSVSTERPEILGTGGGLKRVASDLAERVAVLNGDVLHDVDLAALMAAVPEGGGAMALRTHAEDAERYGIVAADASNTVVRLTSLATADPTGPVPADTHFTGIHALHRDALDRVPEGFACIVRTAYTQLVPHRQVAGIRYGGPWLDAGDPAAYLEANLEVLAGKVRLALDPMERAAYAVDGTGRTCGDRAAVSHVRLSGPAWIGPDARIGPDVELTNSILGEGATVPAGTRLVDSVVWDGATVPAGEHRSVVVYSGGVLSTAT